MNAEPLIGWARFLASRFSAPVLLVGSALTSENPRDVDIRVVMDGQHFNARYGEWYGDVPPQAWVTDMAKISRDMTIDLRMNVDLQVTPEYRTHQHFGKARRVLAVP